MINIICLIYVSLGNGCPIQTLSKVLRSLKFYQFIGSGKLTYSHFKKRWKTFSVPNASYSNKYLSQFFIKTTIVIPNKSGILFQLKPFHSKKILSQSKSEWLYNGYCNAAHWKDFSKIGLEPYSDSISLNSE